MKKKQVARLYLGAGAGRAGLGGDRKADGRDRKSFIEVMKLQGTLTRTEGGWKGESNGEGLEQVFRIRQWWGSWGAGQCITSAGGEGHPWMPGWRCLEVNL